MKLALPLLTCLILTPVLSGCVAMLFAGAAGTTAVVANDRRTLGAQVEDKEIESKVVRWLKEAELDESVNVKVLSFNRHILLIGQAPSDFLRDKVLDISSQYPNFIDLYNEIRIDEKITASEAGKDAWISTKIKSRMLADKELNGNHVKIYTEKGEVFLMGMLTPREKKVAITIARNIAGVKKVTDVFQDYQEPVKQG
ncbi:BON domain-containing protein [Catenovulum maritimum]|uniref:BON domain-containing protein n=1 Tax=Catenovulum maritimum TaxID=1513271 RepID=A0A0J8GP62_9ALTE|nr:BON domain-containing protein [Catenovulum maritimum]KMT64557.1 hypothetical protein XM47_13980 [Catenovulum maritimum]